MLLLLFSNVKNSEILACFEMVLFISFFLFFFEVNILLEWRNFIAGPNSRFLSQRSNHRSDRDCYFNKDITWPDRLKHSTHFKGFLQSYIKAFMRPYVCLKLSWFWKWDGHMELINCSVWCIVLPLSNGSWATWASP